MAPQTGSGYGSGSRAWHQPDTACARPCCCLTGPRRARDTTRTQPQLPPPSCSTVTASWPGDGKDYGRSSRKWQEWVLASGGGPQPFPAPSTLWLAVHRVTTTMQPIVTFLSKRDCLGDNSSFWGCSWPLPGPALGTGGSSCRMRGTAELWGRSVLPQAGEGMSARPSRFSHSGT